MRIAVAMSGGIDSFKAAALLKEQGNDVFGVHMRLMPLPGDDRSCTANGINDREEALKSLASNLGIPLAVVDMREAFEKSVVLPFLQDYLKGLTPNPCVICNPTIKFGRLLREARALGADRLATGHYARVLRPVSTSDRFRLARGCDPRKDQSYFLFGLTQDQLASVLFPLGNTTKKAVQSWAEETGVSAVLPEESQEICFIPAGKYQDFLEERLHLAPLSLQGPIRDVDGSFLGEHKGLFAYTVGQRRGLGIPSSAPYYVVGIEPETNTLRVGRAGDLCCGEFRVHGVNWVSISPPEEPVQSEVRIRNLHQPAPARVTPLGISEASVQFDAPQRAVTPGQAAVFYDGDIVLGGGIIARSDESSKCLFDEAARR